MGKVTSILRSSAAIAPTAAEARRNRVENSCMFVGAFLNNKFGVVSTDEACESQEWQIEKGKGYNGRQEVCQNKGCTVGIRAT